MLIFAVTALSTIFVLAMSQCLFLVLSVFQLFLVVPPSSVSTPQESCRRLLWWVAFSGVGASVSIQNYPWTRVVGRTTHGTGDFGGMCLAKHSGGGQKEGKLKASRDVPRDRSMMDRLPCLLHRGFFEHGSFLYLECTRETTPFRTFQHHFKHTSKHSSSQVAARQTIINHHHHVFSNVAGPTFHVPGRQGGPRADPQDVRLERQRCRRSENANLAHKYRFYCNHCVFGRGWQSHIRKKTGTYSFLASTRNCLLFSPLHGRYGLVRQVTVKIMLWRILRKHHTCCHPPVRCDRHSSANAEYSVLRILSWWHL